MWCDGGDHEYEVTFFYYLVDIYGVAVTTHTHTDTKKASGLLGSNSNIFLCARLVTTTTDRIIIYARVCSTVCVWWWFSSILLSCVCGRCAGGWWKLNGYNYIHVYIVYSVGKGRCLLCALAAVASHYICILLMVCVCDSLRCLNDAVQNHIPNAFQWYIFCWLFRANLHIGHTRTNIHRVHTIVYIYRVHIKRDDILSHPWEFDGYKYWHHPTVVDVVVYKVLIIYLLCI